MADYDDILKLPYFSFLSKIVNEDNVILENSLKQLNTDPNLLEYWKNLNISMEILNNIIDRYQPRSEYEKVIKDIILTRLLNSGVVAMKLIFSGFYQA